MSSDCDGQELDRRKKARVERGGNGEEFAKIVLMDTL